MAPGEQIQRRRRRAFHVRYKDDKYTRSAVATPGKRIQFRRRHNSNRLDPLAQRPSERYNRCPTDRPGVRYYD